MVYNADLFLKYCLPGRHADPMASVCTQMSSFELILVFQSKCVFQVCTSVRQQGFLGQHC